MCTDGCSSPGFCLTDCSRPPSASLISDVFQPRGPSPVRCFLFVTLFSLGKPRVPLCCERPGGRQLFWRYQPTATMLHLSEEFPVSSKNKYNIECIQNIEQNLSNSQRSFCVSFCSATSLLAIKRGILTLCLISMSR